MKIMNIFFKPFNYHFRGTDAPGEHLINNKPPNTHKNSGGENYYKTKKNAPESSGAFEISFKILFKCQLSAELLSVACNG
ncbi:MAG: hypothetical protein JWO09_3125 [Bacteroidetes bacterium]|nr:hypothetical protein [Bacteroidota bacterium]